jgi:hypothetical protein
MIIDKKKRQVTVTIDGEGSQYQEVVFTNGERFYVSVFYGPRAKDEAYRDRAWLLKEYVNRHRSMKDIANQCAVTPMTINTWLKKFNIATRSRGQR